MGVDESYIQDWYLNSIDTTIAPVWTEEHIEELCRDFYLIPKNDNTKNIDFIFNNKKYPQTEYFQLIYDMCGYGLYSLDHDNCEQEGVKIIP